MFLENFTKFLKYNGKGRYSKLSVFFVLSCIAGLLEFVGIALIYPFILLIIQPQSIINSAPYIKFSNLIHSSNLTLITFSLGLVVFIIFITKNLFIIFTQYFQAKFIANWKKSLTLKFMEYYLYTPYIETMRTSQSNKYYVIGSLCNQVIDGFVMRGLNLLTNVIIIFMVISLLLIKFPIAALVTIIFASVSMIIQNRYFKNRTALIASTLAKEYQKYHDTMIESINNLKELKILSSEKIFFEKFEKRENEFRNVQFLQGYYGAIPPYIVEILIVSALLLISAIISIENISDYSTIIASFAIVVAALFRIAPALNRIQTSIININASRDFVKK